MKRYRLQPLRGWIEGAYETKEQALKHLTDQMFTNKPCVYPQICRQVVLKLKVFTAQNGWQEIERFKVFPFKKEHWKNNENFIPCEFKYEIMGL